MVPFLLALLATWTPSALAATSVMSVDPGDPAYEATHDEPKSDAKGSKKKRRGKEKTPPPKGDIQVGPDLKPGHGAAETPQRKTPRATAPSGSRVPGIFAVYEASGRWMLIERDGKRLGPNASLIVIGSRGLDSFKIEKATKTYAAACEGSRPAARRAWLLTAADAKSFKKVGTPVIALLLKPGARFDAAKARFSVLKNEATEAVYQKVEPVLRAAVAGDLASGAFQMDIGDEDGHRTAAAPDPEKIRLKLDFAARLRLAGLNAPLLVVEGAQYSRSYRRCLRLLDGQNPVGSCVEMPHELMVETAGLEFVAYDPSGSGRPFILAFSPKPPLWGHERWGFQSSDAGLKLFLRDALDPRCRDSF